MVFNIAFISQIKYIKYSRSFHRKPKMKNNHGFSNILIIGLILILLSSGGYFLFNYLNKKSEIIKPEDEINIIVDSVKLEIENKKPKYFKNLKKVEDGYVWWITQDGYSIITDSNPAINVELHVNPEMKKAARRPIADDFKELTQIVRNIMQKKGFKLNNLNSNSEIETDMSSKNFTFYDYIQAYEKDGSKCLGVANGDIPTGYSSFDGEDSLVYSFGCTTDEKIKQNYLIHTTFIDLIFSDESYISYFKEDNKNFKKNNIAISGVTISGDRATASVRARRSGWGAFFYKEGNEWKLIHQGQAAPLCSDLEKRGIPKKYHENLWGNSICY